MYLNKPSRCYYAYMLKFENHLTQEAGYAIWRCGLLSICKDAEYMHMGLGTTVLATYRDAGMLRIWALT